MSGKGSQEAITTGLENVSVVIPEQTSAQDTKKGGGRPCCVKVLTVLVIVLLLTIATLIAVFFIFHHDDDENDDVKSASKEEVCTSRDCTVIAGIMSQKMDPSVDPCQNFADYACGGFYREMSLPREKKRIGAFVETSDDNYALLRDIVEEDVSENEAEYVVKLKNAYWSCVNEENVGLQHFMNTTFPSMWPTLNPTWDPAAFELNKVMIEYAYHDITPFMEIDVRPQVLNSSANAIFFHLPTFLVTTNHLLGPRNGSVLLALQTYYAEMAVELSADPEVARKDGEDTVDLLIRVATTSEENTQGYHILSIDGLQYWNPYFDFPSVLQAKFNKTGIQLTNEHTIFFQGPAFFEALSYMLNDTDPRVIQNYFAFHHADIFLYRLTKKLTDISFELDRVAIGIRMSIPLWQYCIAEISYVMWLGAGKEFVKRTLSQESESVDYINEMVDSLMMKFTEILDQADWLSNGTKEEAKLKIKEGVPVSSSRKGNIQHAVTENRLRQLAKMGRRLGYPEENFSEEDINYAYQDISFVKDNYFENRQILIRFLYSSNLKQLAEKVDKSRWEVSIIDANAYYGIFVNEIVIPMGIMKPMFFSANYPRSLNYGSIGSVIGHEIIHGFDDSGSHFDGDGIYRNWWHLADLKTFYDRLQCVVDQYSDFVHPQVELKLKGDKNVGEAVADAAGIKLAFRAFKEEYESSSRKELPLPGLGLTPYQQFFVIYAQRFCQIHTDEWLAYHIDNAYHPPGRFRIIGTYQNVEDFGEVFNCSSGSYMNPIEKCIVW